MLRNVVLWTQHRSTARDGKNRIFIGEIYLAGIAVRKEITINFLELFDRKVARGAIFEKSFIPFLYLSICCRWGRNRDINELKTIKNNERASWDKWHITSHPIYFHTQRQWLLRSCKWFSGFAEINEGEEGNLIHLNF